MCAGGSQHSLSHVVFAPLRGVVFNPLPLFDRHPATGERAAGVVPPRSVPKQLVGRLDRRAGLGHLALPGVPTLGHFCNDLRVLRRQAPVSTGLPWPLPWAPPADDAVVALSRPLAAHPMFREFVRASLQNHRERVAHEESAAGPAAKSSVA